MDAKTQAYSEVCKHAQAHGEWAADELRFCEEMGVSSEVPCMDKQELLHRGLYQWAQLWAPHWRYH